MDRVRNTAIGHVTGAVLGPFEAFLILRGLKTLSYRMQAHCRNALMIADFLRTHPMIDEVIFPGLASHPQFELAQRQMEAPGGMVSCRVKGGYEAAARVIDSLEMISIAVSLGDVETLVEHPASMTHASYSLEERRKAGITENLIRFSIGLEDPEDIIRDIDRALGAAAKKRIIAAPVAFHGAA
jgi:methionine-gamma-lyase